MPCEQKRCPSAHVFLATCFGAQFVWRGHSVAVILIRSEHVNTCARFYHISPRNSIMECTAIPFHIESCCIFPASRKIWCVCVHNVRKRVRSLCVWRACVEQCLLCAYVSEGWPLKITTAGCWEHGSHVANHIRLRPSNLHDGTPCLTEWVACAVVRDAGGSTRYTCPSSARAPCLTGALPMFGFSINM